MPLIELSERERFCLAANQIRADADQLRQVLDRRITDGDGPIEPGEWDQYLTLARLCKTQAANLEGDLERFRLLAEESPAIPALGPGDIRITRSIRPSDRNCPQCGVAHPEYGCKCRGAG